MSETQANAILWIDEAKKTTSIEWQKVNEPSLILNIFLTFQHIACLSYAKTNTIFFRYTQTSPIDIGYRWSRLKSAIKN